MLQAVLLSLLIGQAQLPPVPPARPDWIETLPEARGRLYALGMADLGSNQGQAIARASDSARSQVVARIRTSVKHSTNSVTRTAELAQGGAVAKAGARNVNNTTSVSAHAEDLPGLVVERTFVDPAGRTAYALAYLDLAQAQTALASNLSRIEENLDRVGAERSVKARWRLRKIKGDLDRLDETVSLLALTQVGLDLRPKLQKDRTLADGRLDALARTPLPALDFAKLAVAIRSNVDLPAGMEAYLASQIEACGLLPRKVAPDLILELSFRGGDAGPAFIFTDLDVYQGISYHLEAQIKLLEEGGEPLVKPIPITVVQPASAEGMVKEFRRQFERYLPLLFRDFRKELE